MRQPSWKFPHSDWVVWMIHWWIPLNISCILNDESTWVWMNYGQPSSIFLYSNVDDSRTTPSSWIFPPSVWI
jgi:hypothetical protein